METIIMINNNDVKSLAHTKWNSFGKRRWDDKLVIAGDLRSKTSAITSLSSHRSLLKENEESPAKLVGYFFIYIYYNIS